MNLFKKIRLKQKCFSGERLNEDIPLGCSKRICCSWELFSWLNNERYQLWIGFVDQKRVSARCNQRKLEESMKSGFYKISEKILQFCQSDCICNKPRAFLSKAQQFGPWFPSSSLNATWPATAYARKLVSWTKWNNRSKTTRKDQNH